MPVGENKGRKCQETAASGLRCGNDEAEGLEYCVLHVPDELLDEAEEITGRRRCRHRYGGSGACRRYAIEGSDPPECDAHGHRQRPGLVKAAYAENLADKLAKIMREGGEKLLDPDPLADPLSELLSVAAEMKALKDILRETCAGLMGNNQLRYAHSKAGEQARMEILLYERAVERFVKVLIDISKLRIEDRLAGVREQTAQMLERALDAALQDSGVGLEGQDKARQAFRRHLRVVA